MNNQFKKILLNLAKLPHADQHWVLTQLNAQQRKQFKALQGNALLHNARKFRKLPCPQIQPMQQERQLPEVCHPLGQEDPLFIAIILEQGQFGWEHQFLQHCDQQHQIKEHLEVEVPTLKAATKAHVFQQWQSQLNFQEQLEITCG